MKYLDVYTYVFKLCNYDRTMLYLERQVIDLESENYTCSFFFSLSFPKTFRIKFISKARFFRINYSTYSFKLVRKIRFSLHEKFVTFLSRNFC